MAEDVEADTMRLPAGSKTVAVVVPGYSKFTPDEEVSFRHRDTFLGHYDKFSSSPAVSQYDVPDFN